MQLVLRIPIQGGAVSYDDMMEISNNAIKALSAYLNLIFAYEEFRHGEISTAKGHFPELSFDSVPEQYVWEAKKRLEEM